MWIGAATTAAMAGVPQVLIRLMGHWKSNYVLRLIIMSNTAQNGGCLGITSPCTVRTRQLPGSRHLDWVFCTPFGHDYYATGDSVAFRSFTFGIYHSVTLVLALTLRLTGPRPITGQIHLTTPHGPLCRSCIRPGLKLVGASVIIATAHMTDSLIESSLTHETSRQGPKLHSPSLP